MKRFLDATLDVSRTHQDRLVLTCNRTGSVVQFRSQSIPEVLAHLEEHGAIVRYTNTAMPIILEALSRSEFHTLQAHV